MMRGEFLKTAWRPYPQARSGWKDVASYFEEGCRAEFVCGRLENQGGQTWGLRAGGAVLEFAFSTAAVWLDELRRSTPFDEKILRAGDLVCIRLSNEGLIRDEHLIASGVVLLVPAQNDLSRAIAEFDIERSRLWAGFLSSVRAFFHERGFIEARTPTLVPSPGTEPFLDPFSTRWDFGSLEREYFLPTSPEFHLKKMLVRGWTRIFEFKTCFRNGEISEHHQPEFLMLEWYRAYSELDAIADDVEALLSTLVRSFAPGRGVPSLRRVTMAELFAQAFAGFVLTPTTTRDELVALAKTVGIEADANDSWDDVFFRVFLEKIERELGSDGPVLVRGYPPSQAALSRIGEDGFADRFEVYWHGLELANAFHELNDPNENEARFREDARKKAELGKKSVPVDEELIRDLHNGMPPSGGIALGLDRLFMALFGLDRIAETRAFPIRV